MADCPLDPIMGLIIYVKEEFRRQIGAALIFEKLKQIAKDNRCGGIEWLVLADNLEAIEFYQNFLKGTLISDKLHYMRLELD